MENVVRIDATAISGSGDGKRLQDGNFYINGRHRMEHENGSVQVTVDKDAREHVLAVTEGMDRVKDDSSMSVSMVKELRKAQDKIGGSGGDIQGKLGYIKERLDEVNNVIYSMAINQSGDNEAERNKQMSFACLYLSGTKAAVLSSGSGSVWLLRDGVVSNLAGDKRKVDRLLKMGIITGEQAKIMSGGTGFMTEDTEKGIKKVECSELRNGDVFLICSEDIASEIDDTRRLEILSSDKDSSEMCRLLMEEAEKGDARDPINMIVVRIGGVAAMPVKADNTAIRTSRKPPRRKMLSPIIGKTIAGLTVAAVVTVISIFTYELLFADIPAASGKTDTLAAGDTENETGILGDTKGDDSDNQGSTEKPSTDTGNTGDPDTANPSNGTGDGGSQGTGEQTDGDVSDVEYTVQQGDVLSKISQKFYGDQSKVNLILEKNNMENPDQLQIGDVLIIPGVKEK